jgi:quercetin dioxygenase-like cupin family protein
MRMLVLAGACLTAAASHAAPPTVVLDNARVRVLRAASAEAAADHPAAVVVVLQDGATRKAGDAYWSGDATARRDLGDVGSVLIVEPKASAPPPAPPPSAAVSPDPSTFAGMSFRPLFDNDRVAVIRGRMDVGAREGLHTHASDIVVVHISGGSIEDTADGKTTVHRWHRGDVEFEARGSRHSARNVGAAVDAVLITLKP